MRHRKAGRKFGMDQSARKAMFRNMVTSLLIHGRIRTTEARAKELRRYAERIITIGKRAPVKAALDALDGDDLARSRAARVHAIRRARRWLQSDVAVDRLFEEFVPRFVERSGGYTRVVKAGFRGGDNTSMAIVELVGESGPVMEVSEADFEADEAIIEAAEPSED